MNIKNWVLFLFLVPLVLKAQNTVFSQRGVLNLAKSVLIYEDASRKLTVNEIIAGVDFKKNTAASINFNVSNSNFWLKFTIENKSDFKTLLLNVGQSRLDVLNLFELDNTQGDFVAQTSPTLYRKFEDRNYEDTGFIFDVEIPKGQAKTFLIKLHGNEQLSIPIEIGDSKHMYMQFAEKDFFSGAFVGLMLVMIIYNLFIFLAVKDNSYFFYVLHLTFIALTQMTIEGYTFKYLWPNSSFIEYHSLSFLSNLSGIISALFLQQFLQTKARSKKLHQGFNIIIAAFVVAILAHFFVSIQLSFVLMQNTTMLGSIYMVIASIIIYKQGHRAVRYLLYGWSVLILGTLIFILKDFGFLPYNGLTKHSMQIATSVEAILLSFALSDKINTYRNERLEAIQEKETILKNQNETLETQVEERTKELHQTLDKLKDTQAQLVHSEKMSSLGQLTAGVAHEINNPMNYAKQSIVTIKRDMQDINALMELYQDLELAPSDEQKLTEIKSFKDEIELDYLSQEIREAIEDVEDGIKRAVEIAQELKSFSRIDETAIKTDNVIFGIESTLELMKSEFGNLSVVVDKDFDDLPIIECRANRLNQVFMNILNNSLLAIKEAAKEEKGLIKITAKYLKELHKISIKFTDNGKGMDELTMSKMFDPFYTTRGVGEGSGLGMSISYGIIEEHNGQIKVESELGKGTAITITLPLKQN